MKKYIDIIIINILTIIIAIIVYYICAEKVEILTAIIATGISIAFGLRLYKIENDKMFKELFIFYNQKYDTDFNDYLNEIDQKTQAEANYKLSPKESAKVIDYLNLCAEEYLWFKKGRIDESVWRAWEKGMLYYLNIESINKRILLEKDQKDSYYGFFTKFRNSIKNWS